MALFAIGDILGVFTKAKMSAVFVALFLFLIGFLSGVFPKDIIAQAGLSEIAKWSAPFLIFHMGTNINLKQLVKEWRTVLMSIIAMAVAMVGILLVIPIIGKASAVVSIPIINGGIVATQIMTDAASGKGMAMAAALGTILYAVQKFVGTPPASYFGLKEAKVILEDYRKQKAAGTWKGTAAQQESQKRKSFAEKHEKYYTTYTRLAIAAFFAFLSKTLGDITPINYSIWALFLGAFVNALGLIPNKVLNNAGMLSMAVFASIIPSLANIQLADLGNLAFQLAVVVFAMFLAIIIFIYILPTWKLVGSRNLAVGIAMAQLLGFPATFLIANEIVTAVAETEEEKEVVLEVLLPAYVVAGLASVTSLSIIIAGIFVNFL